MWSCGSRLCYRREMGITCTACGREERDDTALICSGCGVPFAESGSAAAKEEAPAPAEPPPAGAAPEPAPEAAAEAGPTKAKGGKAKKKREAAAVAAGPFCERCTGESSDETAGEVSEGFFFGRSFWLSGFAARRCETCGSEVRTLWNVIAGVPLAPIASYRYKVAEGDVEHRRWRFYSRRLPQLESGQVSTTRIVSLLMLLVVAALIYWKTKSK